MEDNIGPVIVRSAYWPIETLAKLRSTTLSEVVDQWISQEETLHISSADLSNKLYAIIPTIKDRFLRRKLLMLKRHIYLSTDSIPKCLLESILSSDQLASELKKEICSSEASRNMLALWRSNLELLYTSSLAIEHNELHKTTSNVSFRKATYLASQSTFELLSKPTLCRNELPLSKIDHTIYSYLSRSVGRATPNSMWSGVAMEAASKDHHFPITVDWHMRKKIAFAPNLLNFINALESMKNQIPWQYEIPVRLNPTLIKDSCTWEFGNYQDGVWENFSIQNHKIISFVVSLFSSKQTMLQEEIKNHLIRSLRISESESNEVIDYLRNIGFLWSAVQMPSIYDDPWQALEKTIATLPSKEKQYWNECVNNLRKICTKLSESYSEISIQNLKNLICSARTCVNTLVSRYGNVSVGKNADHILFVDIGIPIHFTISSALREKIENAIRLYWSFDRFGMGEIEVAIKRRQEFGKLEINNNMLFRKFVEQKLILKPGKEIHRKESHTISGLVLHPWETIMDLTDDYYKYKISRSLDCWYRELDHAFANHYHKLHLETNSNVETPLCPGSALVLLSITEEQCTIRIGSVAPDPCIFYSRFNMLFRDDPFATWSVETLRGIETKFRGLQFAQLCVFSKNPNAASRPQLTNHVINVLDPFDYSLSDLYIQGGINYIPRICIREKNLVIIPYLYSAISIEEFDIYSKYLYKISHLLGRPSLMRPLPHFDKEIKQWHHLPRLYIDDTTIISPERWTPDSSIVDELVRTSGLERYIVWRKFIRNNTVPNLIYAKYGTAQTEMLIFTDSIIAIENLGKILRKDGGTFLLQEAFPSPYESWLCDENGHHYIAEIAVSWFGDNMFWKNYLNQ